MSSRAPGRHSATIARVSRCRTGASGSSAAYIDPKVLPQADVQQIFLVFFITFTMATMALIHTGVVERIKPVPFYVMSFVVGAVLSPLVGYLCWGSSVFSRGNSPSRTCLRARKLARVGCG